MREDEVMGRLIHFRSVAAALIFFGGFLYFAQNIVGVSDVSTKGKGYFLFFVTILTLYISWLLGRRLVYVFVPAITTIFTYGLLFFIDPPRQKVLFVVCASMTFYLGLLGIVRNRDNQQDQTGRSFLAIALMASLFLYYSVAYGVYINYDIALWVFMLVSFFTVFALTVSSLVVYSQSFGRVLLYSAVLSFAMAQLMWMANFWPFNYSTMAAVNLMFYYVLWDLMQASFTESLSKKGTLKNTGLAIVLLLAVLFSTRWVLVS